MKKLFIIIIIFISFQSWTKADDIRDFQIEGMSIGDSLLDFYAEDEIKSFNKKYYAGSKKYYRLINYDKKKSLKEYNNIMFGIKENDLSYILNTIVGIIPYKENRAVIFNSQLYHATDDFSFEESYENRRINITFLYD